MALSSRNVIKGKCFTGKDVLPEREVLEKAAAIKRFEYVPLGTELKKQTGNAKKQYQYQTRLMNLIKTEDKTKNIDKTKNKK